MDTTTAVLGIYLNDHLAGATMGVELFAGPAARPRDR
jgi:hypothetical protein